MGSDAQDILIVYVTFPSPELASKTCRELVEKGLIACANIFPGMTSVYLWENKLEQAEEVAVFLKTVRALYGKLEDALRESHPYQCPCVLGIPVSEGNPAFMEFIRTQTLKNQ